MPPTKVALRLLPTGTYKHNTKHGIVVGVAFGDLSALVPDAKEGVLVVHATHPTVHAPFAQLYAGAAEGIAGKHAGCYVLSGQYDPEGTSDRKKKYKVLLNTFDLTTPRGLEHVEVAVQLELKRFVS